MKYIAAAAGQEFVVDVQPGAKPGSFSVTVGGQTHDVDLQSTSRDWLYSLLIDGRSYQVGAGAGEIQLADRVYAVEVERDLGLDRAARAGSAGAGPGKLKAPIPGLVVAVHTQPGDLVHEGQALVIVEAMKMQMELKSPRTGRVAEVAVQPGQEVNQGQVLAVIGD